MEKKLFVRQTKCPEDFDKWYTMKKYGGLSPCIPGKPSAWEGSTLANCVGYAWGRFASLEENPDCKVGFLKGTTWPDDAKDWYTNSKAQGYEVSMKAELGAVAVWRRKGTLGHVAVVEKVYADGSWDSSESGYNTRPSWWSKHYDAKSTRSGYVFQGFILPKYEFVEHLDPEYKFKAGDHVQITNKGNSRPDGKGSASYGIGWRRYIIKVHEGQPYSYQVGLLKPTVRTTGYYKEDALKKL